MGPSLFQVPRQEFDAEKSQVINDIFNKSQLADVTLVNGQDEFSAHKLVLASVSPVLRSIFEKNSSSPLLFLRGTESRLIKSMLSFIYSGEASVELRDIDEFIKLGADLEVKGLNSKEEEEQSKRHFDSKIDEKYDQVEEEGKSDLINEIQKKVEEKPRYGIVSEEDLLKLKNEPHIKSYEESLNQMFVMENEMLCKCLSCGLTKSRKMIKRHVEDHLDGAFKHRCSNCGRTFHKLYKLMFPRYHPCHQHLEAKKIDSIVDEFSLALTDASTEPNMDESSIELDTTVDRNMEEVKDEPLNVSQPILMESYTEEYKKDLKRRIFSTDYFREYDNKLIEICEKLSKGLFKCKVCDKVAKNRAHIMEHAEIHLKGQFHHVCQCGTIFNRKIYVGRHLPCPQAVEHDRQLIQSQVENNKNGTEENVVPVGEYEGMIDKFLSRNMAPPHNWLCTNESCAFNETNARSREEALRHIEEVHLPHVSFICDSNNCFERFEKYSVYRKHSKTCQV